MNTLTKDLQILARLGSCIALDKLSRVDTTISKLKKAEIYPEKIYETILQSYLFCGFPAAIESLKIFRQYYPKFPVKRTLYDTVKFKEAGITNCKLVYKKNFKKLIENMNYYSPDLKEWMIIEGYGKVLGRSGLSLLDREYLNVSILVARFYENQLKSHLRGCLNLGATKDELVFLLDRLKKTVGTKNIIRGKRLLREISVQR